MKRATVIAAASAILLALPSPTVAQDWTDWEDVVSICESDGDELVKLSWRRFDHPEKLTEVQWRISNRHRQLYDVTLGERAYTCSNKEIVTQPSRSYGDPLVLQEGWFLQVTDLLSPHSCPRIISVEFTGEEILEPEFASRVSFAYC